MEKRRPTYDLGAVQRAIGTEATVAISGRARRDAIRLGFDRAGIVAVIQSMTRSMFYKSMTTYGDHRVWQDVYHVPFGGLVLYLKIQEDIVTEFFVVAFKEK